MDCSPDNSGLSWVTQGPNPEVSCDYVNSGVSNRYMNVRALMNRTCN